MFLGSPEIIAQIFAGRVLFADLNPETGCQGFLRKSKGSDNLYDYESFGFEINTDTGEFLQTSYKGNGITKDEVIQRMQNHDLTEDQMVEIFSMLDRI